MKLAFSRTALHVTEEAKRMARKFTYQTEIIGEDANFMAEDEVEELIIEYERTWPAHH